MSFPLRLPAQLKQHLRALRKSRGLTQGELGTMVGVGQARIGEIEANPGAVSLDQLTKVLAALGGTLHLHGAENTVTDDPGLLDRQPKPPVVAQAPLAKRLPKPSTIAVSYAVSHAVAPVGRRGPSKASRSAAVPNVIIRAKKGTW